MGERKRSRKSSRAASREPKTADAPKEAAAVVEGPVRADESERALGRAVAIGLPAVAVAGAIVVGFVASLGSALLVLAAGALLGTIALLWASVRTLSGDAPLPAGLEEAAVTRRGVDALAERKREALRALKDLEAEHAIGKIDDVDYQTLVARYRDQAKAVLREMDLEVAPQREEAERIARDYLAARGLAPESPADGETPATGSPQQADADRKACWSCTASNEKDAAFCKKCGASLTQETVDAKV